MIVCGSEGTGEEAAIYIWRRESGELLNRIPGAGPFGHSNIVNQVDGSSQEPYLFISCSDDETVKLWGVKDRLKLDISINRKDVKKINVKDEARRSDEEAKDSAENSDANPRPSNSSLSSDDDIEVEEEGSDQQQPSEEDSDFDQSSSMPDEESEVSVNSI